jgi:trehalose 6-phosphate synthase/phosphatase
MKHFDNYNFKRIIIVAYRLPFKLVRKKDESHAVQNSGGLVSAILSLSGKMRSGGGTSPEILWAGTGEKELGDINVSPGFKLFPVEIPRKINDKFYGGFCNDTLWPLFHYFPSRTVYDKSYFDAYLAANDLFFKKLQDLISPGDFVWVHDYQLFLLPGMIRTVFPDIKIGFFLHIPFPSFELFRLLPRKWREMILSGMTGADVVGFHTNDYTQNFIKSVRRTLGHRVDQNYISVDERLCKADAFPIGIDFNKFHEACYSLKTNVQKDKLRRELSDKKLIFSVDRLDYSKGFLQRLKAFERFLDKYPAWHHKVVFNMVVVPSRDNIEGYREIKKEIEATVGRINGKYSTLGWRPIIYQYKSLPFNELVAIYNLSDVGLITPLRDGMNLVSKEFVACQTRHYGMLVLSELAGASVELNESILINPTDTDETADAINKALSMPDEEKKSRIIKMQNRLSRYNVFTWTTDFFDRVDEVKKEQMNMKVKYMDSQAMNNLRTKYENANKRLFLIDYDGTLTPIARLPEMAVLDESTKNRLRDIIADKRNTVVIISGRRKEFLEEQFAGIDAVLVAEHGYLIKRPDNDWKNYMEVDLSWKEKIRPVLDDYVDRCPGSMVEEKQASVVWHYRNAEEEYASLRIHELKDDLSEILKSDPKLQALQGKKVLEIKSILYDKGTVASAMINEGNFDFILALGDDNTDEDLFKAIPDFGCTIKVGPRLSNARYSVRNQSQINEILSLFAGTEPG